MSRRHDRYADRYRPDGDLRRLAEQFADAYRCPDCLAEKRLESCDGVYVLDVRHDPSCATYRSRSEENR